MSPKQPISTHIQENESYIRRRLAGCDDIIIRPMLLGEDKKLRCVVVYIEVAVSNLPRVAVAVAVVLWHLIASFTISVEFIIWILALPSDVIARSIVEYFFSILISSFLSVIFLLLQLYRISPCHPRGRRNQNHGMRRDIQIRTPKGVL